MSGRTYPGSGVARARQTMRLVAIAALGVLGIAAVIAWGVWTDLGGAQ